MNFKNKNAMEMIPIGKNAGMLWNLLESGSEFSVSQLVSKLDMTRDDLFSAIGWIMNFFSVINVFKVIFISGSFRAYSLNFPSKNIIKPSLRFF